jgi:hypothetical protein
MVPVCLLPKKPKTGEFVLYVGVASLTVPAIMKYLKVEWMEWGLSGSTVLCIWSFNLAHCKIELAPEPKVITTLETLSRCVSVCKTCFWSKFCK